ncbi:hypothetical protein GCM10009772_01650 [Pseudonocardia alni subsp. carboxydivorans]
MKSESLPVSSPTLAVPERTALFVRAQPAPGREGGSPSVLAGSVVDLGQRLLEVGDRAADLDR